MELACTDEQVKQMAAVAINASQPMGMGFLQFNPKEVATSVDVEIHRNSLHVDYHGGRMVKFHAHRIEAGKWSFADELRPDYQSWCHKYHSYTDLLDAITSPRANGD